MVININIGVLGHVDSGKTSLAKCLSDIASTAAFDKNPQSKERGITLDLGFSSFTTSAPKHLADPTTDYIQYTLVDCPGHASLIKTILGGAQIIDFMLLVIDVTKGIQTQTAECIVIGEITNRKMIIVLNKIDLLDEKVKSEKITKLTKNIRKSLSTTLYGSNEVPFVNVSSQCDNPIGIDTLIEVIKNETSLPCRSPEGNFVFAIDHCFPIKGQGTVLTGTILQGSVEINNNIYFPKLGFSKKVKSMQMYRQPISRAIQGDRVGICTTQLDAKSLERGIACTEKCGTFLKFAVIKANVIKYFKHSIESKAKFHITIGYETVLAKITAFFSKTSSETLDYSNHYEFAQNLDIESVEHYFLLLEFDKPVFAIENSIIIGSKLDMCITKNSCRLAFWGKLLESSKESSEFESKLKIFKTKMKVGLVDRVVNENTLIVKNLFKKETDLSIFLNFQVEFSSGEKGRIEGSFGQGGKVKVYVSEGFKGNAKEDKIDCILKFKKCIFGSDKKLFQ